MYSHSNIQYMCFFYITIRLLPHIWKGNIWCVSTSSRNFMNAITLTNNILTHLNTKWCLYIYIVFFAGGFCKIFSPGCKHFHLHSIILYSELNRGMNIVGNGLAVGPSAGRVTLDLLYDTLV